MRQAIFISQIIVTVLLTVVILLQQRGSGLTGLFGGGGNIYRTKRGLEKGLFATTIALVALFVAIGILNLAITS